MLLSGSIHVVNVDQATRAAPGITVTNAALEFSVFGIPSENYQDWTPPSHYLPYSALPIFTSKNSGFLGPITGSGVIWPGNPF